MFDYLIALGVGAALELALLTLRVNDGSGWIDLLTIAFPAAALLGFRHPTFVLPFYFFIGSLKNLPVLRSIPGNLSILMGLYVAAACGVHLVRDRRTALSWRALAAMGVIALLVMVAYIRSQMPLIAHEKLLYFLTFVLVSFVSPMILVVDRRRVEELFVGLIAVAVLVLAGMFLLTDRSLYLDERMGVSGASSIVTGVALLMGAIAALYWWFPRASGRVGRVAAVVLALACIAGVAVTGSRGPFLFGLATLAAGFLFHTRAMTRDLAGNLIRVATVATCLVVAISGLRASWMAKEFGGTARALSMISGDWQQSVQSNDRVWLMRTAVDMLRERPLLGHGLGGYQRTLTRGDEWDYTYPHNLPLDIGCEAGLPAAFALLFLYGLAAWRTGVQRLVRPPGNWLDAVLATTFLLLLFSFLEGLVSNDVFRARAEWGTLGLAHAVAVLARRERAG
jgi:O-antigen ligase